MPNPLNLTHRWDLSPQQAITKQLELVLKIRLTPMTMDFQTLGAADIGYASSTNQLAAVVATFRWPELHLLEIAQVTASIRFPYIPGLLSFREVPVLLDAFGQLKEPPDVLLCDGQGMAHPRRFGLASHLGLCLGIPTVGCAKKRLCGEHEPLPPGKGASVPLMLKGEVVGTVYRSRDHVKPIFISPGHLSDVKSSTELVRRCLGRFRLPEPIRKAHSLATELRRSLVAVHPVT